MGSSNNCTGCYYYNKNEELNNEYELETKAKVSGKKGVKMVPKLNLSNNLESKLSEENIHPPMTTLATDRQEQETYNHRMSQMKKKGEKLEKEILEAQSEDVIFAEYLILEKIEVSNLFRTDKVLHKPTNSLKIMKQMSSKTFETSQLDIFNEISILKTLNHKNILKVFECFHTSNYYYILSEYFSCGTLKEYTNKSPISEEISANILYQILHAIYYCHTLCTLHSDLRLENIVINSITSEGVPIIKIGGFSYAKIFHKGQNVRGGIAVSSFTSPEVLLEVYNEKCDIWSVGMIMFNLLTGAHAFTISSEHSTEELHKKIKYFIFNTRDVFLSSKGVSKEAKDLLTKLLERNNEKRISAEEALEHPWFKMWKTKETYFESNYNKRSSINHKVEAISIKVVQNKNYGLYQRIATCLIVNLTEPNSERKDLDSVFQLIDEDSDGKITKSEFAKALEIVCKSNNRVSEQKQVIAQSVNDYIYSTLDYEEFIYLLIDKQELLSSDYSFRATFDFFNKDLNGFIVLSEFKDFFRLSSLSHMCGNDNGVDVKNLSFERYKEVINSIFKGEQ